MSESKKKGISIPGRLISVAAMLLVALMGLTVRASVRSGRTDAIVENNVKAIEKLEKDKAEKDVMEMTYDAVVELTKEVNELNKYVRENK